jgi:hypothetical protein
MRVRRRRHDRCRPLDQVLIDPERLVKLPKRLLEAMHDRLSLRMVEALEVHTLQAIEHADGSGLRQEGGLVHEAPQCDETVQGACLSKVFENAGHAHHDDHLTSISHGACFAASYRLRLCPDRSKICNICGSRDVLTHANV